MQAGQIVLNGVSNYESKRAAAKQILSTPGLYSSEEIAAAKRVEAGGTGNKVLDTPDQDPVYTGPSQAEIAAAAAAAKKRAQTEAAISNTRKAIDSTDTELETGYGNIDDSFDSLIQKYAREAAKNEGEYVEQGNTNSNNLQKNKQNALLSAAQGRRGLRGTLAAIGALSGDGSVLADRAVTTGANQDIGEAADTFAGNATTLNKAIGNFRDEDEDRRKEAKTTRVNQRTALEGRVAEKRQNFFQKMAELYGDIDDTGAAKSWLDKAGDLNDTIAKKTRVAATAFAPRAAAFTPGDLENYLAGAGDMTVDVTAGGTPGVGGPNTILAGRGRRKKDEEAALATA
jgi:hypothetical protein